MGREDATKEEKGGPQPDPHIIQVEHPSLDVFKTSSRGAGTKRRGAVKRGLGSSPPLGFRRNVSGSVVAGCDFKRPFVSCCVGVLGKETVLFCFRVLAEKSKKEAYHPGSLS